MKIIGFALIGLAVGFLASYLVALAGAPQQVWFWRDVVGLL
jgi:hypothetical protein